MKKLQLTLLVVLTLGFVTKNNAQHRNVRITNGVGLYGGLTLFDIETSNFETIQKQGWIAGLSATVDLPHKWYNMSYNIQLSENQLGIEGRTSNIDLTIQEVNYKLFTAQVALLMNVKLIESYVTLDVGPMLQYNSNLELKDDSQEGIFINNFDNVLAEDISEISRFNINGTVGLTAGFGHFKVRGQYIYGFTNILKKLNDNDAVSGDSNTKFKGNQNMIALTAIINF